MGDKINTPFYNDVLHKKMDGLFPVLIANRPSEAMTEEEKDMRRKQDPQPKILFPDPNHSMVVGLKTNQAAFRHLIIDRYYPTQSRLNWNEKAQNAEAVVVLPNRQGLNDATRAQSMELVTRAIELGREVALADADFKKYAGPLQRYEREVRGALASPFLFHLVRALDRLRHDQGAEKDPDRPNMNDLWAQPKMKDLAKQIDVFQRSVLYGDPLVVTHSYGKGKVVAFLTTAGTKNADNTSWNEWGEGNPVSWSYPVFMMDMERYLTSGQDHVNRLAGTDEVKFEFDTAAYEPGVVLRFHSQERKPPEKGAQGKLERVAVDSKGVKQTMTRSKDTYTYVYNDFKKPGVYHFDFTPKGENTKIETRSFAVNVDAATESDLKRATQERLLRKKGEGERGATVTLRLPGDKYEEFKHKEPDTSELPWLYLLFLVLLIAEQALAVHLSFHLKSGDAAAAAPRAQPAAA
jgi:hypothetical protein